MCQACAFVFYLDPKVAACTICMVDGGIVLLRRTIEPRIGTWVFPGGFVDRGEAVSAAAIRETLEEKFTFLFEKLRVVNSRAMVAKYVKPVSVYEAAAVAAGARTGFVRDDQAGD